MTIGNLMVFVLASMTIPLIAMQTSTDAGSPSTPESSADSTSDELMIRAALEIALDMSESPEVISEEPEPVFTAPVRAASPVKDIYVDEPPYSYVALISMSIENAPDQRLTLSGICNYFTRNFYYFRCLESEVLRKSIRYNLSVYPCFKKLPADAADEEMKDDSHHWILNLEHKVLLEKGAYRPKRKRPVQHAVYSPALWAGGFGHRAGASSQHLPYGSTTRMGCLQSAYSAPPPHNTNHNNNTCTALPPPPKRTPSRTNRGVGPEGSLSLPRAPCYFTRLGNNTVGWSNGLI